MVVRRTSDHENNSIYTKPDLERGWANMFLNSLLSSHNDWFELLISFFLLYLPFWASAFGGGKTGLYTLDKWYNYIVPCAIFGGLGATLYNAFSTTPIQSAFVFVILFLIGSRVRSTNREHSTSEN